MKISLNPEQEQFVKAQLANGRYRSADEVITQALKVLEQQQREYTAWVEDVRVKVDEAAAELARGEGVPLETVMQQIQERFRKVREAQE